MFQSGTLLGSRYRLDEPIASGGMAEVWQGFDTILKRAVAIKLLHPHLANDPVVAERFRREAIAAAGLGHPHIVPTFDTGNDDGAAFIVMGLVHGPTLREIIDRKDRMTTARVAMLGRQIADALDHAHSRGIIHRDIKPANVLLVDGTRVMVTDFGIAKAVEEVAEVALTMPGLVVATPGYSAPEQLAGQSTDARTDVYALGVLVHELSCGHAVTDSPTAAVPITEVTEVTEACPSLPDDLRHIVGRATALDPDERYQTAAELRDELESIERATPNFVAPVSTSPAPEPPRIETPKAPPSDHTITMPARKPSPTTSGARRRRTITLVVVLVLVVAAAVVGRAIGGLGGDGNTSTTTVPAAVPLSTEAHSFDPFGSNKTEHESEAARAVDGNTNTAWTTESYEQRTMNKPGVGISLKMSEAASLRQLDVRSRSRGWSAEVYVANGSPDTLEGWGNPVDSQSGLGADAKFDLHNAMGDSVLLWVKDIGDTGKQFSVTEMQVAKK